MHKLLIGGATAAMVASAAIAAQPAPAPPPGVSQGTAPAVRPAPHVRTFVHRQQMKTQTRDEVVAHASKMFARLDGNKDGYVTREEADARRHARAGKNRNVGARRMAGGDLPKRDRGAMFDKLDTNKDGSISRQEFVSAKRESRERRVVVMRDGQGPVEVGGAPGRPGMTVMRLHRSGMGLRGRMFERADANRDGRVSLQEMTATAVQRFDEADANRDGKLTPEERTKMHRTIIERHRKMKPA